MSNILTEKHQNILGNAGKTDHVLEYNTINTELNLSIIPNNSNG